MVKPSKVSARKCVYNKSNRVYDLVNGMFICNVESCKAEYNSANSVCAHHKYNHATTFKYPCKFEKCDRKFNNKTQWAIHQNAHTGKKEHICSNCKKAFSCRGNLNRHMKACM